MEKIGNYYYFPNDKKLINILHFLTDKYDMVQFKFEKKDFPWTTYDFCDQNVTFYSKALVCAFMDENYILDIEEITLEKLTSFCLNNNFKCKNIALNPYMERLIKK